MKYFDTKYRLKNRPPKLKWRGQASFTPTTLAWSFRFSGTSGAAADGRSGVRRVRTIECRVGRRHSRNVQSVASVSTSSNLSNAIATFFSPWNEEEHSSSSPCPCPSLRCRVSFSSVRKANRQIPLLGFVETREAAVTRIKHNLHSLTLV